MEIPLKRNAAQVPVLSHYRAPESTPSGDRASLETTGQDLLELGEDSKVLAKNETPSPFGHSVEANASFPAKLYTCLEDSERKGFTDVISWQPPDGRCFKVHNQNRFIEEILPIYFGHIKFKSWQRQLNLYGFTRIHKGVTRGSYVHPDFIQGNKALAMGLSRQTSAHDNDSTLVLMPGQNQDPVPDPVENDILSYKAMTPVDSSEWTPKHTKSLVDPSFGAVPMTNKGPSWRDDVLVDRGSLGPAPRFGVSERDSRLDDKTPAEPFMPSAEELCFLLDVDEKQLSEHGQHQSAPAGGAVSQPSLNAMSRSLPPACDLMEDLSSTGSVQSSRRPVSARTSFPWKLHEMLEEATTNGYESIVSWEPDGMAFKVHDCQKFVEKVMPLYFDQTRYESFRRQLRKYGFSRLNKARYRGAYHHEFFQRDNKHLCKYISRSKQGRRNK